MRVNELGRIATEREPNLSDFEVVALFQQHYLAPAAACSQA
jgi:hypothetical protein